MRPGSPISALELAFRASSWPSPCRSAGVDLIESVGRKTAFIDRGGGGRRDRQRLRGHRQGRGRRPRRAARRPPRVLRRRHRPRRRPPLDPRRARLASAEGRWRPGRLEGQARRGGRAPDGRRRRASLAMTPEQILDVGHRAGSEHRHLHVLRKSAATPSDLPRKSGMAKKRPRGLTSLSRAAGRSSKPAALSAVRRGVPRPRNAAASGRSPASGRPARTPDPPQQPASRRAAAAAKPLKGPPLRPVEGVGHPPNGL